MLTVNANDVLWNVLVLILFSGALALGTSGALISLAKHLKADEPKRLYVTLDLTSLLFTFLLVFYAFITD